MQESVAMDTYETITTRRSIRRYRQDPVPAQVVRELLTAAMSGPSSHNRQPWHFVVVTERSQLDALASIEAYERTLSQAPLAIVVCVDLELARFDDVWLLDCAIAAQNMILLAHDRGLGACWLECHFREDRAIAVRDKLRLPDRIRTLAVVSIGYPAETKAPIQRYDEERVHLNAW
jgi:nitroreductase